jgi:hypothetical protein
LAGSESTQGPMSRMVTCDLALAAGALALAIPAIDDPTLPRIEQPEPRGGPRLSDNIRRTVDLVGSPLAQIRKAGTPRWARAAERNSYQG